MLWSSTYRLLPLSLQIFQKTFFATTAFNLLPAVESVKLAFSVYNDGKDISHELPPLIIMHGLFGSRKNWHSISKRFEENLTRKRKIITLDARNHGDSPHSSNHTFPYLAQDVVEFLRSQNINKACLLGHSMGGRAMIYLALNFPEIVERVIIVDSNIIKNTDQIGSYVTLCQILETIKLPSELSQTEGRKQAEKQLNAEIHPKMVEFLLQNLIKDENKNFIWKFNIKALESNMDAIMGFPEDILNSKKYNGPALIIGGKSSGFITSSDLDVMKNVFPNIAVNWIDCGHLVHIEEPIELFKVVDKFLS